MVQKRNKNGTKMEQNGSGSENKILELKNAEKSLKKS